MQHVAICKECGHKIPLGESKHYMSPCPICRGEMKVFDENTVPVMASRKNILICFGCGYETKAYVTAGFCPLCSSDMLKVERV